MRSLSLFLAIDHVLSTAVPHAAAAHSPTPPHHAAKPRCQTTRSVLMLSVGHSHSLRLGGCSSSSGALGSWAGRTTTSPSSEWRVPSLTLSQRTSQSWCSLLKPRCRRSEIIVCHCVSLSAEPRRGGVRVQQRPLPAALQSEDRGAGPGAQGVWTVSVFAHTSIDRSHRRPSQMSTSRHLSTTGPVFLSLICAPLHRQNGIQLFQNKKRFAQWNSMRCAN